METDGPKHSADGRFISSPSHGNAQKRIQTGHPFWGEEWLYGGVKVDAHFSPMCLKSFLTVSTYSCITLALYFLKLLFIYLFIGRVGSSLLHAGFL